MRRWMWLLASLFLGWAGQDAYGADADKLWREVVEASKPPVPPESLSKKAPSAAEKEAYRKELGVKAAAAADKAREFYTQFPDNPNAADAREKERNLLTQAIRLGQTQLAARLEEATPKEEEPSEDDRVRTEVNALSTRAMAREAEGKEAVLEEFEKGLTELLKKYPNQPGLWGLSLEIAKNSDEASGKRRFKAILDGAAPEEIKEMAQKALRRLDAVGQPFEMSFTALDGREIDAKKLKGKVVLIDFWATWCGPCLQELPNVLRTYKELNKEGFEILGISLDKSKSNFERFLKDQQMTWPQYFDGKGWGNKFVIEHNVLEVPTMWLVDKKGILRDLKAREGLEAKVRKLLAEP